MIPIPTATSTKPSAPSEDTPMPPTPSPMGAATFEWFVPARATSPLAHPMRWHGHLAHDSRAGLPACALCPHSRQSGRLSRGPSLTLHGQGSRYHFHSFTANPTAPGFSRRPQLDTGFSPWDWDAAGFSLSRLQPGFSMRGFIHTPSYVAAPSAISALNSHQRRAILFADVADAGGSPSLAKAVPCASHDSRFVAFPGRQRFSGLERERFRAFASDFSPRPRSASRSRTVFILKNSTSHSVPGRSGPRGAEAGTVPLPGPRGSARTRAGEISVCMQNFCPRRQTQETPRFPQIRRRTSRSLSRRWARSLKS